MNALTLCNNCDAADAVTGDPRGYCAECVAETDGPAKFVVELDENEIVVIANALWAYCHTGLEDEYRDRLMRLRGRMLDAWVLS